MNCKQLAAFFFFVRISNEIPQVAMSRKVGRYGLHLAECAASSINWRDWLPRPRLAKCGLLMIYDLGWRWGRAKCENSII